MIDPKSPDFDGLYFFNTRSNRMMILVDDLKSPANGWLVFQHPGGNWVSKRKATKDDLLRIIRMLRFSRNHILELD